MVESISAFNIGSSREALFANINCPKEGRAQFNAIISTKQGIYAHRKIVWRDIAHLKLFHSRDHAFHELNLLILLKRSTASKRKYLYLEGREYTGIGRSSLYLSSLLVELFSLSKALPFI